MLPTATAPPYPPSTGGITYERAALQGWIARNGTDPATGHALSASMLYSNLNLRDQICGFFLVKEKLADVAASHRRHRRTSADVGVRQDVGVAV